MGEGILDARYEKVREGATSPPFGPPESRHHSALEVVPRYRPKEKGQDMLIVPKVPYPQSRSSLTIYDVNVAAWKLAGFVQPSHWLGISNRSLKLMKVASELGLSPASRTRVSVVPVGRKPWEISNDDDEFFS